MNARWHEQHPMPKNAGLAVRVAWHVAHRKGCACRPLPASIAAALAAGKRARPATSKSTLTRPLEAMPADVRRLLAARRLTFAYRERPAYQQNDYLRWIARAKLPATRQKRVEQMLEELTQGGLYMKMKWAGGSLKASVRATRTAR